MQAGDEVDRFCTTLKAFLVTAACQIFLEIYEQMLSYSKKNNWLIFFLSGVLEYATEHSVYVRRR